jgi:predicted permease
VALAPEGTPRIEAVATDGRVLAVALAVTALAALVAGLLPALRMGASDLRTSLVGGGRGASASASKLRLRSGLVVLQVGMAVALLGTAGMIVRSFAQLRSVDMGFEPQGVMSFFVSLQGDAYQEVEARGAFFDQLLTRLEALPGVESVGGVSSLPLSGFDGDITTQAAEAPIPPPGQRRAAWFRRATPDYIETLGLSLVSGRGIEVGDQRGGPPVAVINQTLAQTHFPDLNPLGRRIAVGDPDDPLLFEVVGVVKDIRNFDVRDDFRSAVYVANAQYPAGSLFLALRAADGMDPTSLVSGLRGAVAELDPTLAVSNVVALPDLVADALGPDRFLAVLLGGFAALALILAVVGLYGVVSYSVGARVRELGVRVALGADAGTIRTRVILASMGPVLVGVGFGLALAWVGSRFTEALLYQVSPVDPITLSWTVLVLLVTACAAAAIPASRAARVDPMTVLREE